MPLEWVEHRLLRWAEWVTVGDGSGFPTMSVLHSDWSPPTPGLAPGIKVANASDVHQTHAAVKQLSMRQANAVVVRYVLRLPGVEEAERLACSERTVRDRIDRAHRQLAAILSSQDAIGLCNMPEEG